jgi:hypothetical protein
MKKFEIELKWSFLATIAYLLWFFLESKLGWHSKEAAQQPFYNLLFLPTAFFVYFMALKDKKKNYFKNEMNWKQSFLSGIFLSFFIAVLTPSVIYITFSFISPDFFNKAIQMSTKNGLDVNKAIDAYNMNTYIKNSVFDKLSFGIVIAAIVSLFLRTKEK